MKQMDLQPKLPLGDVKFRTLGAFFALPQNLVGGHCPGVDLQKGPKKMRLARCGNSYEILLVMDLQDVFSNCFYWCFSGGRTMIQKLAAIQKLRFKNFDWETTTDSETTADSETSGLPIRKLFPVRN